MVGELEKLGYWAYAAQLDSSDYGSKDARHSGWWLGLRGVPRSQESKIWFHSLLMNMKMRNSEPPAFAETLFLEHSVVDREYVANITGVPCWTKPGTVGADAKGEKLRNLELFTANKFQWPVPRGLPEGASSSYISFNGMTPVEADKAWFLDKAWPRRENVPDGATEYIVISPALATIRSGCLEPGTGVIKEGSYPWKRSCEVNMDAGKILLRYLLTEPRGEIKCGVRLMEVFERYRMLGWDDTTWVDPKISSAEDLCQVHDDAAKTVSAFHYIPWTLATLSTLGKFMVDPSEQPKSDPAKGDDKGSASIDAGDAASSVSDSE